MDNKEIDENKKIEDLSNAWQKLCVNQAIISVAIQYKKSQEIINQKEENENSSLSYGIQLINKKVLENLDKYLHKMQYIFNTVPVEIVDKKMVELIDSNSYVIDIASKPGVNLEALNTRNIKNCWYLQIPSKDSPKRAAMYIKETVDDNIRGM